MSDWEKKWEPVMDIKAGAQKVRRRFKFYYRARHWFAGETGTEPGSLGINIDELESAWIGRRGAGASR